jgi:hypothetical protein
MGDKAAAAGKKKQPEIKAGANVRAEIDKEVRGPFYLVQIAGDVATLQGAETIEVPVSALRAMD